MIRDVSATVRVADQPRVIATLIVDADTGLVRGVAMAPAVTESCTEAVDNALSRPAGPLPPEPPARIVHHEDHAVVVTQALTQVYSGPTPTMLGVEGPLGEAEDVFDSLLGHLSGRRQPSEPPTGGDWSSLYAQASRYCRAEPWRRWSDAEPFALEVETADSASSYLAVVLGQAGIQRGLAVYPGDTIPIPDAVLEGHPPEGLAPTGSLLFWLDALDEVPEDYAAKATRYGWSDDLPLVPMPVTITDAQPADLDRVAAQHLTLALAAVVDLHEATGTRRATGRLRLDEGAIGSYSISAGPRRVR